MKIAWIDHSFDELMYASRLFKEELEERGFKVDAAQFLQEFLEKYGGLEGYEGVIMHPGITNYMDIKTVKDMCPGKPFAIVTNTSGDYREPGMAVFSYISVDEIAAFFRGKGKD